MMLLNKPNSLSPSTQDEREARETVKREQDEAYRLSLEADRKKVRPEQNISLCLSDVENLR